MRKEEEFLNFIPDSFQISLLFSFLFFFFSFSSFFLSISPSLLKCKAGKKQLGFLNTFIYQNAAAFTDVTAGSDKIGRGGGDLPYGFDCT